MLGDFGIGGVEACAKQPNTSGKLEGICEMLSDDDITSAQNFREMVRTVALPASEQFKRFQEPCDIPFEIASDYCDFLGFYLYRFESKLSLDNKALAKKLDTHFDAISGEENAHLWTEAAVESSREWAEARSLAHRVLVAFGWTLHGSSNDQISVKMFG